MALTRDPSIRDLNDCGGCEGVTTQTPVRVTNRPALNAVARRVGTHSRFLDSMVARLSSADHPALNSRDPRDLTMALLDACAAVDDGLTFYIERYGNEWLLRTATERLSLLELGRLIGYQARPGVAASTALAFTIEDTPGTPELTTIPAGTRVMSIPGKDELPQIFETGAEIEARAAWNAMVARTHAPQVVSSGMTLAVVQGIESGIRRGDSMLIVESETVQSVKRVQRIVQEPETGTTRLELADNPAPSAFGFYVLPMATINYSLIPLVDNSMSTLFGGQTFSSSNVSIFGTMMGWSMLDFGLAANTPPSLPPATTGVYALRSRAALFGHNAPRWATLPQVVDGQDKQIIGRVLKSSTIPSSKWQYPDDWDNLKLSDSPGLTRTIDLDNSYPALTEGSWVVLESPSRAAQAYRVGKNQELTRSDYALSAKVTRLELNSDDGFGDFKVRDTTVFGQSEQLPLAMVPITQNVQGDTLVLGKYYPGLVKGQQVIVQGTRVDLNGVPGTELRTLADVLIDGTLEPGRLFTVLKFTTPLDFVYRPETVRVNANVAEATHGESKAEVLGGGDGISRYQTFALRQGPLTYVSAETPTGARAELEVRVNEILWEEAESLYGRQPDERVYVVRHEESGQTRIQFNAPLPTGQENVRAAYRIGIGTPGLLKANQLSLLAVRPLGVRSVTNPLPPTGAADREGADSLRQNSALGVLTLGRLVSLRDYEDFTRGFAGFAKALATPTVDGSTQGIFLTVGGDIGPIPENSPAFANLVSAIRQNGDPFATVVVKPYRAFFFQLRATVGVDSAYLADEVVAAVQAVLRERFAYGARRFGQSVTRSEVIATIQGVAGVQYVDLNALFRTDPLNPAQPESLEAVIPAALPVPGSSRLTAQAAELLLLDPRPIEIAIA